METKEEPKVPLRPIDVKLRVAEELKLAAAEHAGRVKRSWDAAAADAHALGRRHKEACTTAQVAAGAVRLLRAAAEAGCCPSCRVPTWAQLSVGDRQIVGGELHILRSDAGQNARRCIEALLLGADPRRHTANDPRDRVDNALYNWFFFWAGRASESADSAEFYERAIREEDALLTTFLFVWRREREAAYPCTCKELGLPGSGICAGGVGVSL